MAKKSKNLPDFKNPPVIEVVLSVQFEELEKLGTPQMGLLWQEYRKEFPRTKELPPLSPSFETFGTSESTQGGIRFAVAKSLPLPRLWFLNDSTTRLIQVQNDRFIQNWRKLKPEDAYPRFEKLRTDFAQSFETFRKFIERENLGPLSLNQWEVTYVNHIAPSETPRRHEWISRVFSIVETKYSDDFLGDFEEAKLNVSYVISDGEQPLGRLRISIEPAYRADDKQPIVVMKNIARGPLTSSDHDAMMKCLDVGHEWIVRGFASITTREMHRIWGRSNID